MLIFILIHLETGSGAAFSCWATPANPTFDFKTLMDAAVAAEADEPPVLDDGMDSPLSSPLSSPPSSPTPPPPRILPHMPSATNLSNQVPSTSQSTPTNVPVDEISKASFRKKNRSHKNRANRRKAEVREMGYAPHRESVKRALHKHVAPSNPVKTSVSINATDMASTGYIGLREQFSKKIFTLNELVGEGSLFHFQLIPWDGMYVDSMQPALLFLTAETEHPPRSWTN
jgi:hypothetical protein